MCTSFLKSRFNSDFSMLTFPQFDQKLCVELLTKASSGAMKRNANENKSEKYKPKNELLSSILSSGGFSLLCHFFEGFELWISIMKKEKRKKRKRNKGKTFIATNNDKAEQGILAILFWAAKIHSHCCCLVCVCVRRREDKKSHFDVKMGKQITRPRCSGSLPVSRRSKRRQNNNNTFLNWKLKDDEQPYPCC